MLNDTIAEFTSENKFMCTKIKLNVVIGAFHCCTTCYQTSNFNIDLLISYKNDKNIHVVIKRSSMPLSLIVAYNTK